MAEHCDCGLCRRHRRLRYVMGVLRRAGDEPSAAWLSRMFESMLDTEVELEMLEAGGTPEHLGVAQYRGGYFHGWSDARAGRQYGEGRSMDRRW